MDVCVYIKALLTPPASFSIFLLQEIYQTFGIPFLLKIKHVSWAFFSLCVCVCMLSQETLWCGYK